MARTPTDRPKTCNWGILTAILLAVSLQLFLFSPSSPGVLQIPPPSSVLPAPSNGRLQEVIKLGEGQLKQPEDVAVDRTGVVYTATRDGWIKRLLRNGTWESWKQIESGSLLGLTTTTGGGVVVCDAEEGLLEVGEEGVRVLVSHVDGAQIRFADDVVGSSDGTLYFSVASTKHSFRNWPLDMLEDKPYGQLLTYNPSSNIASVLLENLGFANGVALSANEDYVVVCETWKYRCLKYWLQGDVKGQTEILIDNLPGAPDNIKLAPDGSFWIALLETIPNRLRYVYRSRAFKYLITAFPELGQWVVGANKKAMVVNVGSDGKIIRGFDDPTGKVMAFVTSALEFEGHLYLGSLHTDFVGKLPL
ncbi:protein STRICTOSIDINE SYNTHASE-LIKE 6 [Sesamum angolense]|uniref:Protein STRICTOSIDINE SYNTHASE-LIKE 6 n=1 Tax=Sesamum angolense TaxID=2727404 RepID=A0AAE2BT55_9LAMI|nr:protein STRICTOSIDINE SYNTHASE-LIKE 6 [Sesamum angolense]